MTQDQLDYMLELRTSNNNVNQTIRRKNMVLNLLQERKAWEVKVDIAMPCAFQNELNADDANN